MMVTNTGGVELTVTLVDPRCDAGTSAGSGHDDVGVGHGQFTLFTPAPRVGPKPIPQHGDRYGSDGEWCRSRAGLGRVVAKRTGGVLGATVAGPSRSRSQEGHDQGKAGQGRGQIRAVHRVSSRAFVPDEKQRGGGVRRLRRPALDASRVSPLLVGSSVGGSSGEISGNEHRCAGDRLEHCGLPSTEVETSVPVFEPGRGGSPLVFLVRRRVPGWVQVRLPIRPNGSRGWVRTRSVALRARPDRITVSLRSSPNHGLAAGPGDHPRACGRREVGPPDSKGIYYIAELAQAARPGRRPTAHTRSASPPIPMCSTASAAAPARSASTAPTSPGCSGRA